MTFKELPVGSRFRHCGKVYTKVAPLLMLGKRWANARRRHQFLSHQATTYTRFTPECLIVPLDRVPEASVLRGLGPR